MLMLATACNSGPLPLRSIGQDAAVDLVAWRGTDAELAAEVGEAPTVSLDAEGVRPDAPDAELASCWRPDSPVPPAPASCASSTPRSCPTPSLPDTCLRTAFNAAVKDLAKGCQAACGSGVVAFAAGCATEVTFEAVSAVQGTTQAAAMECLRAQIVGVRWNCMVPDGWARFRIASCTLE
jgi:hypothetical protein